eukprot:IDg19541t1
MSKERHSAGSSDSARRCSANGAHRVEHVNVALRFVHAASGRRGVSTCEAEFLNQKFDRLVNKNKKAADLSCLLTVCNANRISRAVLA